MGGCIFCQINRIKEEILWESKNFYVKVGIGILAPGHVMIISKEHLTCFGELPARLDDEFLSLKEEVYSKVKSNFSEPIVFEHGIYGQSINHGHMHIIPTRSGHYSINNIRKTFFSDLKSTKVKNFSELRDIFREEGSYLYLKENGARWIFHMKEAPKGKFVFRKLFADFTGLDGLRDWKTMPAEEKERNLMWVDKTKEALKA